MTDPRIWVSFKTFALLLDSIGPCVEFVRDGQDREGIRLPDRYSPTGHFDVFPTTQPGPVEAILDALP